MTDKFDQFDVEDGEDWPVNANWWNTVWEDIDDRLDSIEDLTFTFNGLKTFSTIPVLPASDPTTANQAVRKSYADGIVHNAVQLQARTIASTAPSNGQALAWNSTSSEWEPSTVSGIGGVVSEAFKTISVSGQSDIVADQAEDTLTFIAGTNMTIATTPGSDAITLTSSGSTATLGDVGDVTLTGIASGELLKWNGSAWINNTLAEAGISSTGHDHDAVYAAIADGVTNGDSHDHSGGDGAQINHTTLSNVGTNTHAQIDTHVASTANPHSVTAAQAGATEDAFKTIAVSGQDNVVADAADDTLNLAAGSGITITTTAASDTVTITGTAAGQSLYDAIVAPSGGDYTLLSAAITAGKKSIFIRNGTYSETSDITLSADTHIVGESRDGAILDFGANDAHFVIASDGTSYVVGTVTLTSGDATLVGVGTTWVGNIDAGDVIYLTKAGHVAIVDSVTDNTHLEFTEVFEGESNTANYCAFTPISNIQVRNLTIIGGNNAASIAFRMNQAYNCLLQDIVVRPDASGNAMNRVVRIFKGFRCDVVRCRAIDLTFPFYFEAATADGSGLALCRFIDCVAENSQSTGFTFRGGCHRCDMIGCVSHGAGVDGFNLGAATDAEPTRPFWCSVTSCHAHGCDVTGIHIVRGIQNLVVGCTAFNSSTDYLDTADNTTQSANNFA